MTCSHMVVWRQGSLEDGCRRLRSDNNFRRKKKISLGRKAAENQGKTSSGKDGCLAGDLPELGFRVCSGMGVTSGCQSREHPNQDIPVEGITQACDGSKDGDPPMHTREVIAEPLQIRSTASPPLVTLSSLRMRGIWRQPHLLTDSCGHHCMSAVTGGFSLEYPYSTTYGTVNLGKIVLQMWSFSSLDPQSPNARLMLSQQDVKDWARDLQLAFHPSRDELNCSASDVSSSQHCTTPQVNQIPYT